MVGLLLVDVIYSLGWSCARYVCFVLIAYYLSFSVVQRAAYFLSHAIYARMIDVQMIDARISRVIVFQVIVISRVISFVCSSSCVFQTHVGLVMRMALSFRRLPVYNSATMVADTPVE